MMNAAIHLCTEFEVDDLTSVTVALILTRVAESAVRLLCAAKLWFAAVQA